MSVPDFLKRTSTWSLLLSGVAIILSQSPPVKNWFRGHKVTLRVSKECFMSHSLGKPMIQFTLDIENTGGRPVELTDIDCFLKKSTGDIINLPIKAYLQSTPTGQSTSATRYPITLISLRPGERWNAVVFGYEEWSEAEDETVNSITSGMVNDIQAKRAKVKSPEQVWSEEANEDHVKQAMEFFKAHFKLTQGQYVIYVAVKKDDKALAVAGYPLVIFAYHIQYLRSMVDYYRWGSGILPNYQTLPDLRLLLNRPLADAEASRGYTSR